MEGSQKAASSTSDSKKPPSPDNLGEKDFLSSWKSENIEKDTLDFGTETVPRDRKKAFDFSKPDDFELGGDFGNISSFKVDMSDLDFSSPHRKTEKGKERPGKESVIGKKDEKMDPFSFNFDDFDVLDGFDLYSISLKKEKNSSKCSENEVPKSSVKVHQTQDSRSNSLTSSDILEKNDTELLDDGACSRHLTNFQGKIDVASGVSCLLSMDHEQHNNVSMKELSSPDHEQHDNVPPKEFSSPMKQVKSTRESQNGGMDHIEQIVMTGSEKPLATAVQAGDDSAQDTHSKFNANPAEEQESIVKAMSTSHSRSSIPVVSSSLNCLPAVIESPSIDNGIQNHLGERSEAAKKSITVNHSAMVNVEVEDASMRDISHTMVPNVGENEEKPNSSPRDPQSLLPRDTRYENYMPLKDKGTGALQMKPLNRSEATESQLHSSTSKQLYNNKMETMRLSPASEKSESRNAEQSRNYKGSILKSLSRPVTNGGSVGLRNAKNKKDSYALCTPNSTTPKLLSSIASLKSLKTVPIEKHGTLNVKRCDNSSMKIPRVITSNGNPSNSTAQQVMKSVGHAEKNVEIHLNKRPMVAHSLITEKHAMLSPPLKRKSLEVEAQQNIMTQGPSTDPRCSSFLKCVTEAPVGCRKSLKASPEINGEVDPTHGNVDDCCYDVCLDYQNSSIDAPVEGRETHLVLIENDGNAEKAEACTKALEDICNMLKKKNEEAKELLVRAIVNNNSLLMLNHPMHEEKIRAIQKFASSLQSKSNGI